MAESPTPETGTPDSQSPARTPPALLTTEELLQSMVAKCPEVPTPHFEPFPSRSVSRRAPMGRYEYLKAADAEQRLQGLRMPPEEELRKAALGAYPAVGPPPCLPHQLSGALQHVLLGWRAVYESCSTAPKLQALVGEFYAREAVFEDALVSARGQEAVYRQFAMLGAAVRSVQVGAYSLSVAPLSQPHVFLEAPPPNVGPSAPAVPVAKGTAQPRVPGQSSFQEQQQQARPQEPHDTKAAAVRRQRLHLMRVTVENAQCFELGLPTWLTWLIGDKCKALQVHLYVTSILLVASDVPLAMGAPGGFGGEQVLEDVTAVRLRGAAAALGRDSTRRAGGSVSDPVYGATAASAAHGAAEEIESSPSWRIVHHVDVWHNVPLVWWRLRRALCIALDALLGPLLRV